MKLGIAFIVGIAIGGCSGTSAQNARTAGDYEAAQLACVDKSSTRAEADACRCAVKAQFGRPCVADADGGAK